MTPTPCVRCDDTGWIEYTGGLIPTQRGMTRATPEKPIYKRCPCKKQTPAEERQKEVRIYE